MIQTVDIANQDTQHQVTNESSSSSCTSSPTNCSDGLLADDAKQQQQQQQQPVTTTRISNTSAASQNNNTHLRGRRQTITQNNINSKLYLNDQDKLHHAIQKFDTMEHEEPLDSDSDSEQECDHHVHSNRSTVTSISSLLSNDTNYDILLARLGSPLNSGIATTTTTSNAAMYALTTTTQPSSYSPDTSTESSSTPASITSSTHSSSSSSYATTDQQENEIDWEFWSQMISNVDQVIKTNKHYLHPIRQGIPTSLRGTLWPILSRTKNNKGNSNNTNGASVIGTVLDDQGYLDLLNKDSIYEKAITRDLDLLFADQQGLFMVKAGRFKDSLFHLLKAYANYDDHVGYAKGFTYIALPLLLHMPEEEAFCVFVELMNGTYQWKSLYAPPTDGLSRVLFQLDGLMMEHLPTLYHHFVAFGIHANDYAKAWFTTLFVSSLPSLDCVYSIYDILLAEGTDMLYGFALALLKVNQDQLLAMTDHGELLTYLLNKHLGDAYKDNVAKLVQDSMEFKVQKKRLVKLAKEYQQAVSSSLSRKRSVSVSTSMSPTTTVTNDMEALHIARHQNKALLDSVKQRQAQLEQISKQQGQSTKELAHAKVELATARQSNEALRQQSFDLKKALDVLPEEVEARLKQHIHSLTQKNIGLVDRNSELEYRLSGMEAMLMDIKAKFAQSENERDELNQRLDELRELVN